MLPRRRYPAGFVYIYGALYWATSKGADVLAAQHVFKWVYLVLLALVFAIYRRSVAPPVSLVLLCLSKRVHSIFVLRLFNDGVAMLLLYAAVLLFSRRRWKAGCVLYSLAVSVKMNVILFAPGLLLLLLQSHSLAGTAVCLGICASVQLALGWPFLRAAPMSYLRGAFDLGRVFEFKCSPNPHSPFLRPRPRFRV
jgi:alpha-1,3-mannosyltransferase